jgi:hypothetical protein
MDPNELQAIAAALISSRAIGVPTLPTAATRAFGKDDAAIRLRELIDDAYHALFGSST